MPKTCASCGQAGHLRSSHGDCPNNKRKRSNDDGDAVDATSTNSSHAPPRVASSEPFRSHGWAVQTLTRPKLYFEKEADAAVGIITADVARSAEANHVQNIANKVGGVAQLFPETEDSPYFTHGDLFGYLMEPAFGLVVANLRTAMRKDRLPVPSDVEFKHFLGCLIFVLMSTQNKETVLEDLRHNASLSDNARANVLSEKRFTQIQRHLRAGGLTRR